MDPKEKRGLGRGLEAKGALQSWTLAAPNTLSPGCAWIHLIFFGGGLTGRGDGDPLRRLDLEPSRDPAATQQAQSPEPQGQSGKGRGPAGSARHLASWGRLTPTVGVPVPEPLLSSLREF